MKKIILLFVLVFIMLSCKQEITDFGIVTKVESKKTRFTGGYETNYKVTISSITWSDAIMFTNDLYNVGDTIKVINQNTLKDKNYEQRN